MNEEHQREAAIFDAAMELPPDRREAYLEQACAGDHALRQRIESLLKADESQCEFLDPPTDPALGPTRHRTVPVTEKPGDRIGAGRYKLLEQIGEGGCGVVYVAEQTEPVRRRVALKILKLGMDTKSVIARFEAERQALALMDHPHIAKVFDAGATDTGRPYFVMELVRGLRITDYCDEKKLSTEVRLDLFVKVCHAIQHAHQKGIIHRDIKPSNILVTVNDGVAVPKVIDFGVAKATGGQVLTDKTVYTAFEQFIGTPAYMSPEQAVLTSLDIDTRSDIYALGVLLYELLTGQTPFDARELLAIGLDEMRRTIREKEPDRPSARLSTLPGRELSTTAQRRGLEAPKLVSELRGDLDWIVMKCLEKDRARRYDTANGVAADIQRHLNNEPVVACPPSRWYAFQKTVRRHKLGFAATAAVMVALASGLAVAGWMFLSERAALERAVTAEREQNRMRQEAEAASANEARLRVQAQAGEQKAQTEAAKSEQVSKFLQEMLQGVGPSVAMGRDTTILSEILDRTAERLDKELTDQPEVEAALRSVIGTVYYELGECREAETMFERSLSLLRPVTANDDLTVADILHNLAESFRRSGQTAEAVETERKALAIYRQRLGPESGKVGASLNNLGFALRDLGKLADAETTLRNALEINQKAFGNEHPQFGVSLSRLGYTLLGRNKLAEGESMLREAVRVLKKAPRGVKQFGLKPPEVELGWTLNSLCGALETQGRLTEAEEAMRQAVAEITKVNGETSRPSLLFRNFLAAFLQRHGIEKEVAPVDPIKLMMDKLGPDDPDTQWAMNKRRDAFLESGRPDQALPLLEEMLKRTEAKLGPDHPATLSAMIGLADAYRQAGKIDQALPLHEEVVKRTEAKLGPDHSATLSAMIGLANAYDQAGKFDQAIPLFEEALKRSKAKPGPDHLHTPAWMNNLANAYSHAGKLDQALPLFEEALKGAEVNLGPDDRNTLIVMNNLAFAYGRAGKLDQALPLYQETLKRMEVTLGPTDRETLNTLNNLADAYGRAGKPDKALPLHREALKRTEAKLGPDHQDTMKVMINLAGTLASIVMEQLQAGKFAEAEPGAQESLRLREKLVPNDWLTCNTKSMLGGSLLGQKKYEDAEPLLIAGYEGMMARINQISPQGRPRLTEAVQRLVQLYQDTDRPERAAEWKRKQAEWEQKLAQLQSANSLREQATRLGQQGKWKEAADNYYKLIESDPTDHWSYYYLTPLLATRENQQEYRDLCQKIVARFGDTTDQKIARLMAKVCLIRPDSGVDLDVIARWAEIGNNATEWGKLVKGLTAYRQGDFPGAIEWLNKALPVRKDLLTEEIYGRAALALAHHRLNQPQEARAAFALAAKARMNLPELESGDIGREWWDWIMARALMDEARGLIGAEVETTPEVK